MKTKLINLSDFRKSVSVLWKESVDEPMKIVVKVHNRPVYVIDCVKPGTTLEEVLGEKKPKRKTTKAPAATTTTKKTPKKAPVKKTTKKVEKKASKSKALTKKEVQVKKVQSAKDKKRFLFF